MAAEPKSKLSEFGHQVCDFSAGTHRSFAYTFKMSHDRGGAARVTWDTGCDGWGVVGSGVLLGRSCADKAES